MFNYIQARIAQLVAHRLGAREVPGLNLATSKIGCVIDKCCVFQPANGTACRSLIEIKYIHAFSPPHHIITTPYTHAPTHAPTHAQPSLPVVPEPNSACTQPVPMGTTWYCCLCNTEKEQETRCQHLRKNVHLRWNLSGNFLCKFSAEKIYYLLVQISWEIH